MVSKAKKQFYKTILEEIKLLQTKIFTIAFFDSSEKNFERI